MLVAVWLRWCKCWRNAVISWRFDAFGGADIPEASCVNRFSFPHRYVQMVKDINSTDRRLLALLQMNARESVAALARKLGVARTTVQERITRLERSGTIVGYAVLMRRDPFEQYVEALVLLSIASRKTKQVIEQLRQYPEIVLCQVASGEYELVCRIRVPHLEDIHPVLEEIEEVPGVERVRSIMMLSTAFDYSRYDHASATALDRGELG